MMIYQSSIVALLWITCCCSTWTLIAAANQEQEDANLRLNREDNLEQIKDSVPSWEELDKRTQPTWYNDAKFGIFIHWGVFSVPALCSEWFGTYWREKWSDCFPEIDRIMKQTERPNVAYEDFASRFQAELYNASDWSKIFAKAGAQYVILTSKHHEGFNMWNSTAIPSTWHWNVMDVGPRRDLVAELASAIKASKSLQTGKAIKFGLYHSMYEWFNPLYTQDKMNNFTSNHFVTLKTMPELIELVEKFEPEIMWSDGEWEASSEYWQSRKFLQWYTKKVTTGLWNDRWGSDTLCKHGDFLTCTDRYNPGHLVEKKWENAMTIDKSSWGWNRMSPFESYLTTKSLVDTLIQTVAYNGNLLLNIGPSADGTLSPIFVDRLLGIGEWLDVNGPAIYGTKPWSVCQSEDATGVYYTRTKETLFVHVTQWPQGNTLHLDCPTASSDTVVSLLGYSDPVSPNTKWYPAEMDNGDGMIVHMPQLTPDLIPCQHAWVLALSHVANLDGPSEWKEEDIMK